MAKKPAPIAPCKWCKYPVVTQTPTILPTCQTCTELEQLIRKHSHAAQHILRAYFKEKAGK